MGKENIWRNNGHIFFKFDEMYTFTDPEQSIYVAIFTWYNSVNITVEKTADYVEVVIPEEYYENKMDPEDFELELNEGDEIVQIDVTDGKEDKVVLGEDGFYHYGTANGPIVYE